MERRSYIGAYPPPGTEGRSQDGKLWRLETRWGCWLRVRWRWRWRWTHLGGEKDTLEYHCPELVDSAGIYVTLPMFVLVLIMTMIELSFLFLSSRITCFRHFFIYPFVFSYFLLVYFFPLFFCLSSARPSVGESDRAYSPILTGHDFSDFFASSSTDKYPLYFRP